VFFLALGEVPQCLFGRLFSQKCTTNRRNKCKTITLDERCGTVEFKDESEQSQEIEQAEAYWDLGHVRCGRLYDVPQTW